MVRCSPTEFTEFTEFGSVGMAGMPYPPNLCTSVKSVGEYLVPETSVHIHAIRGRLFSARNFCGKIVWWLRGYGRDAIPS